MSKKPPPVQGFSLYKRLKPPISRLSDADAEMQRWGDEVTAVLNYLLERETSEPERLAQLILKINREHPHPEAPWEIEPVSALLAGTQEGGV